MPVSASGSKLPGGLFQRFAHDRRGRAFAGLYVAGRLVEHQRAAHALLDEQEFACSLHDCGDREVGSMNHGAGF